MPKTRYCGQFLYFSAFPLAQGARDWSGDEVVVPSLTWCSTANAALYLGCYTIFCDVELGTMSASPATILAAVTDRAKAIIHVHYGGLASDMTALRAVYRRG